MTTFDPIRNKLRDLDALAGPLPEFDLQKSLETPMQQFMQWLQAAIDAHVPEPHAMVLATVDENDSPDARVLLLKDLDDDGWHFAANASGPKGRQMHRAHAVALTFYWPLMGRQVRVRGTAVSLGSKRSADDFLARSLGSRATALAGGQSENLDDPAELERQIETQRQRLAASPSLIEPAWTAYAVAADTVEFWQGSADRRHRRLLYTRTPSGWTKRCLRP
jgi:pyridoxamine 5'-phosphate oxidase